MSTEIELKSFHKIRKSANLIESKFKLPLLEQRILALCISKINPKKNILENPYRFSVKEYCSLTGSEERGMFQMLREAIESLKTRTLCKYDADLKRERIYGWIDKADVWDNGKIDIYIHNELSNELLVKKKYAEYLLRNCLNFKSKYTLRFYELFEHWSFSGNKKINVDNLREMIGLDQTDYPRYTDFKKRVLSKSINEINSETEIHVEISEFRKDRKVDIIEFIITKSPPKISKTRAIESNKSSIQPIGINDLIDPSEEDQAIELLSKFGIGAMVGASLINNYGIDKVKVVIDKTLNDKKEGKFKEGVNISGVVINRIKDPEKVIEEKATNNDDLKKKRGLEMNWLNDHDYSYDPYHFDGNWVGVEINGKIINFMNPDFREEVEKTANK
jgi:plasmid replication initiation protein